MLQTNHTNQLRADVSHSLGEWIQIVRGEYLEIPGMQLTQAQIQRLWGLDEGICGAVLKVLTEAQFLSLKPDGRYIRADRHGLSAVPRPRERRVATA